MTIPRRLLGFGGGMAAACCAVIGAAEIASAPDARLTPGEVVSTDRDTACAWGHTARLYATDKPAYEKQARYVFGLYGIPYSRHAAFELDHLVPRCAGGADTVANLWPQMLAEARIKDEDEREICRRVCDDGTMPIREGQQYFIKGEWR